MSDTTAVLVHGALTDASIWSGVTARLQEAGVRVLAPALPMRSLEADADYLRDFLATIDGPVVLAGHSYGGTVISHPSVGSADVRGLVFVSAFAPASGESTGELNNRFPGTGLTEDNVELRPYAGGTDLYLRPEAFSHVYAGDLSESTVAVMAAGQRPIEVAVLSQSFEGTPTWTQVPSWTLVSTEDRSLPVEAMRWMAQRAGSRVLEVACSHASPAARPDAVADLVLEAVRT